MWNTEARTDGRSVVSGVGHVIRTFSSDDLGAVCRVEQSVFEGQPLYPAFFFVQAAAVFGGGFLVAGAGRGDVSGYLIATVDADRPERGWVLSLAVEPARRGHGLAHSLMDAGEAYLAARGCVEVVLTVDPLNHAARALYRKRNYTSRERWSDYFGAGADRILMAAALIGASWGAAGSTRAAASPGPQERPA